MKTVDASVAICAFNEEDCIATALESALLQETRYAWEVIVVDDGSIDRTRAEVERVASTTASNCVRLTYLRITHAGLSTARNAALDASRGRVVAYLDADAIADPVWLDEIVRALDDHEEAVAAGGEIAVLNAEVPFARFIDRFHHRRAYLDAEDQVPIIGANMAFRRTALEAVGGFDPRFVSRGDDDSVRWDVSRLGELIFVRGAEVSHERPGSLGAWLNERRANGRARVLVDEYVDARRKATGADKGRLTRIARGRLRTSYLALMPAGLLLASWHVRLGATLFLLGMTAGLIRSAVYFSRGWRTLRKSPREQAPAAELMTALGVALSSSVINDINYFKTVWLRARQDWSRPRPSPVIEEKVTYPSGQTEAGEGLQSGTSV